MSLLVASASASGRSRRRYLDMEKLVIEDLEELDSTCLLCNYYCVLIC